MDMEIGTAWHEIVHFRVVFFNVLNETKQRKKWKMNNISIEKIEASFQI
jgi:hypothetical protein